jgi:hypothetical protein
VEDVSVAISTRGEQTAAALFALLWNVLSDSLGTAATATLLRRAMLGVTTRAPELAELRIERAGLEYRYCTPASWNQPSDEALALLKEVITELAPLLRELTGTVMLRRLDRHPDFRAGGITFYRGGSHE